MSLGSDCRIKPTNYSCHLCSGLAPHTAFWCCTSRYLRATYGAAVKECVEGFSDSHQLQTWLYELAGPQFTTVYANNQIVRRECHESAETLTANWETLQSHVERSRVSISPLTAGASLGRVSQLRISY